MGFGLSWKWPRLNLDDLAALLSPEAWSWPISQKYRVGEIFLTSNFLSLERLPNKIPAHFRFHVQCLGVGMVSDRRLPSGRRAGFEAFYRGWSCYVKCGWILPKLHVRSKDFATIREARRGLFPNLSRTYSEKRNALWTVFANPQTENERVRWEGGGAAYYLDF